MKVLVCGGRSFSDRPKLFSVLNSIQGISAVVNGGCCGADAISSEWAREQGIKYHEHPADWTKHGKMAGPIRNSEMLAQHPDIQLVIAFAGGHGTRDMVYKAKRAGIMVKEVP